MPSLGRRIKLLFNPSTPSNNPKGRLGLRAVFPSDNAEEDELCTLDVILVHGLNGGSDTSWRHEESKTFWPRELLPEVLPRARIMTYGYNANLWSDCGYGRIRTFADKLLADLDMKRGQERKSRPILFICHSMGGLVLKEDNNSKAISIAKNRDFNCSFLGAPIGIFFFATPHRGSDSAIWANIGTNLCSAVRLRPGTTSSAQELQSFSTTVTDIHKNFVHISDDFIIYSFSESLSCRGLGLIVEPKSAHMDIKAERHQVGLNASHIDICRFRNREEDNWVALIDYFRRANSDLTGSSKDAALFQAPPHELHEDPRPSSRTQAPTKTCDSKVNEVAVDVPFYRSRNFTARPDNVLEQMTRHFKDKTIDCHAFGLYGGVGVGKTQIALKFMHDNSHCFTHRLWVYSDQEQKINTSYESIAKSLKIEGAGTNPKQTISAVRQWLERNSNWLLVFDNVEDIKLIESYWPREFPETSYIIVTSRLRSLGSCRDLLSASAKVDCFTTDAAAKWLWSQIAEGRDGEESLASDVVKRLDCLPLAIKHMAAYIQGSERSLRELLEELDQDESIAVEQELPGANLSYENKLSTAWNLSLSRLASESPEASALLDLVSLLDPDTIPLELISHFHATDDDVPSVLSKAPVQRRAINTLVFQSLLEEHNADGKHPLRIHRMTQTATRRRWMLDPKLRGEAFSNALLCICKAYPRQEKGGSMVSLYPECAKFTAHLQSILRFYQHHDSGLTVTRNFAEALAHCGWYFFERGETESALQVLEAAKSVCFKLGDRHSQTLGLIYNNLGATYMLRREERKGLEYTLLAIENRERTIWKDDPEIQQLGISYMNYANDMQLVQPFNQADAAEYYKKALDICQNSPGGTAESQELVLSNMGCAYYRWGKLDEAVHYIQQAVDLHPQCGPDTTFMLYTLYYHGNIQWARGCREEGYRIHKDCLRRRQALQEGKHYTTGVSLYKTGRLAFELQDVGYALECLREAEDIFSDYHDDPGLWPRSCLKLSQVLEHVAQQTNNTGLEREAKGFWTKGIEGAWKIKGRSFMGRTDEELDSLVREVYS
ncbi:NB-ARC domain-containing protein [Fusarium keratoplasticum]|uniref:NB-ARC domain-containing protein n=1 Tax=Fusarium keratoplasticum TaxID=1328300 RepID=A0ACC0QMX8_9HYPO|nr:NB-ARC domain-containing protein [Fusarium keratoplasticum]KAI8660068.1 NB-ARC domain-containing protein [Fusarium keratoplasticum]